MFDRGLATSEFSGLVLRLLLPAHVIACASYCLRLLLIAPATACYCLLLHGPATALRLLPCCCYCLRLRLPVTAYACLLLPAAAFC